MYNSAHVKRKHTIDFSSMIPKNEMAACFKFRLMIYPNSRSFADGGEESIQAMKSQTVGADPFY